MKPSAISAALPIVRPGWPTSARSWRWGGENVGCECGAPSSRFRYHVAVLKCLEHYLRKHRLVHPGERIGLAVSGGADSVALLRAFAELAPSLGVVLFVLHLNHNLRGAASDADANFVRELASGLSLDSAIETEDVAGLAALLHLSIEAAGRRARYAFFHRAAAVHRLDCIATAHTRDDQAETVLLRLLRGAGTSGLAGIHRFFDLSQLLPQSPASLSQSPRLIRPLLSITRQQVEEFLRSLGQPFRQDASNLDPRFLRNRVRGELLPALERDYNPRLRQALSETAEIAAAEDAFLDSLVYSILGPETNPERGIEVKLLHAQPLALQRRILRRLCRPHGLALDFAQIEALREFSLAGHVGRLNLPRGFVAEIVRQKLLPPRLFLLAPKPSLPSQAVPESSCAQENSRETYCLELPVPGSVALPGFSNGKDMYIRAAVLNHGSHTTVPGGYNYASFLSLARAGRRLTIRNLCPGDRFHPLHSSGERKINRLLQELSIPPALRRRWPVALAGGRIIWVPGLPVASHAAWTSGEAKQSSSGCTTERVRWYMGESPVANQDGNHAANYQVIIPKLNSPAHRRHGPSDIRDYQGRSCIASAFLDDGFVFLADLVRAITGDVLCQFVKPHTHGFRAATVETKKIFYAPEVDVEGQHVLLCHGMLSTGQTTDFLIRNFQARGAASVAVCALLDRQSARRVHLEVDYCGFLVGPECLAGFGLGAPALNRNLPFIYAAQEIVAS